MENPNTNANSQHNVLCMPSCFYIKFYSYTVITVTHNNIHNVIIIIIEKLMDMII